MSIKRYPGCLYVRWFTNYMLTKITCVFNSTIILAISFSKFMQVKRTWYQKKLKELHKTLSAYWSIKLTSRAANVKMNTNLRINKICYYLWTSKHQLYILDVAQSNQTPNRTGNHSSPIYRRITLSSIDSLASRKNLVDARNARMWIPPLK